MNPSQVVQTCLEMATNYKRRFLRQTRTFPLLMFWLIYSKPDLDCANRRQCASDILDLPDGALGVSTVKLRQHFKPELIQARDTGFMHSRLWNMLNQLANVWWTDTQEVEGANSIIKAIASAGPNTTWNLLSSRLLIKKNVGKMAKDEIDAVARACEGHHRAAMDFKTSEFDSEMDATKYEHHHDAGDTARKRKKKTNKSRHDLCAAAMVLRMRPKFEAMREGMLLSQCALQICVGSSSEVWMVSLTHYKQLWAVRLLEFFDDANELGKVSLAMPFDIKPLLLVLADKHSDCCDSDPCQLEGMAINGLSLIWDNDSTNAASISNIECFISTGHICRPLHAKRLVVSIDLFACLLFCNV